MGANHVAKGKLVKRTSPRVAKKLKGRYRRNNRRQRSYLDEIDRRGLSGNAHLEAKYRKLRAQFDHLEREFDRALRAKNVRFKVYGERGTRPLAGARF